MTGGDGVSTELSAVPVECWGWMEESAIREVAAKLQCWLWLIAERL